ncbi:MAG: hypothetical protein Q8N34_04925 [Gammaproteobacteria bacterium]|nr:hypothetical protein [Gammaproteobacteria bacterium]
MRFHEIANLTAFKVAVRLETDKTLVQTVIWAESISHAQRMLRNLFGKNNVISVFKLSAVKEAATKPQSPEVIQAKALNDKAKKLTQQAKLVKARSSADKAQDKLAKAVSATTAQTGQQS